VTEVRVPAIAARRRVVPLLAAAVAAGIVGGTLLQLLHRAHAAKPALPELNGQAVWPPGARPAPDFALRDQSGALVTLRSLRGRTVLLAFLDSQCRSSCPIVGRQLGSVLRRLPAPSRPAVVVVSVDPRGDTPAGIRHALRKWRLEGSWRVHWVNAPARAQLASVWKNYGVVVQPTSNDIVHSLALYLIDRRGDERTAYLFPFLQSFVQHDLARLAEGRA
jgi:cytochrome oxidase Cu insertion factor (SCO1/SenC/PrrC family)